MSKLCFLFGLASIPLSIALWFLHPEFLNTGLSQISDPALREALSSAHAERWGIFVGLWPATLLTLSAVLDKKN